MVTCNSIVQLKETERDIRFKVIEENVRKGYVEYDFVGKVVYISEQSKEGVTASHSSVSDFGMADKVEFNREDIEEVVEE